MHVQVLAILSHMYVLLCSYTVMGPLHQAHPGRQRLIAQLDNSYIVQFDR